MGELGPYQHTNSFGVTYYLNVKDVKLRAGKIVPIYFFSRDFRSDTSVDMSEFPKGYQVAENPRNGFLTIRRIEMVPDTAQDSQDSQEIKSAVSQLRARCIVEELIVKNERQMVEYKYEDGDTPTQARLLERDILSSSMMPGVLYSRETLLDYITLLAEVAARLQ